MKIFTIGFTKTTAQRFFTRLKDSGAKNLVDVRLNNISQLAGFAKRDDLKYFTNALCGMGYQHVPALAPTQEMLDAYKKGGGDWDSYALKFNDLISKRHIETLDREMLDGGCLICSEDKPHHCHRRLVAEYLQQRWPDVEVVHL